MKYKYTFFFLLLLIFYSGIAQNKGLALYEDAPSPIVIKISMPDSTSSGRWSRTLRATDGALYMHGKNKSVDNGKSFFNYSNIDIEEIVRRPERASVSDGNLFYAINGQTDIIAPGVYGVKTWRSTDRMKTMQVMYDTIYVPDGPVKHYENEWYGIYVFRTIIKMPDGSWLMTMYGNFTVDTILPCEKNAQQELKYMQRTFVVTSKDKGRTWHYLSSVAVPSAGEPLGEGFVEPAITLLKDGRLLCVMRSGHHYPLYASWSSDGGKTWTMPIYTGLDRGCDPCLITLKDGRVALSWGRRFPEAWSTISPEGDQGRFKFPGQGYVNLAISNDNGLHWVNHKILKNAGTCYSTIIEVEHNILFCQSDGWNMRIQLRTGK